MTKYNRITGKVFGGNANATGDNPEIGQFGSAKDGSYIGTSDISTIQALPAWGKGWIGAVTPETNFPPLPEMTGAMKVFSEQQCYLLQQGIPEWDNATIYYKNGFSSQNGKIYISQSDENQGNDPETDTVNWKELLQGKANKDLDNLTEAGEKHFLNKSQITNCLLEVPQKIKLELNDGTLTLKAGSQVIVPNGFEADGTTPKFDEVICQNDLSCTQSWNGTLVIWYHNGNFVTYALSDTYSGTTPPNLGVFYNTSDNTIKRYTGGTVEASGYCFPLGIATSTGGKITSIDQVFNGMGYIGSTVWVDKGVKGLIPNGRNEDGSLKNIEYTRTAITISTVSSDANGEYVIRHSDSDYFDLQKQTWFYYQTSKPSSWGWWYNPDTNFWYQMDLYPATKPQFTAGNVSISNGVITSLSPKLPFRAVDYNDFEESLATKADVDTPSIQAPYIKDTYENGTSGYIIWSNGYCVQWGRTGKSTNISIIYPKTFANNNYNIQITAIDYNNSANDYAIAKSHTNNGMVIVGSTVIAHSWYVSGYLRADQY